MASNPAAWYSVSWTIVRDYVKYTNASGGEAERLMGTEEEKEDDDDSDTWYVCLILSIISHRKSGPEDASGWSEMAPSEDMMHRVNTGTPW